MAPISLKPQTEKARTWDIQGYNRLILAHQDQVFTLALHLLGSETAACSTVENAFQAVYQSPPSGMGFRLQVLRQVVRACLQRGPALPGPRWMPERFAGLSNLEKVVLILVDCLQLSDSDAATVIEKPQAQVRRVLAGARRSAAFAGPETGNDGR